MKGWKEVACMVVTLAVFGVTSARAQSEWLPMNTSDPTTPINRSGSVAIGASATTYRFQVSSGRSIFEAGSEKYALGLRYSPAFGNTQFWLGASNSAAPDLILSNMNGGEVARFLANGAVGIGTSVPSYKFQVSSGRSVLEAPYETYALGLRYSGAYGNTQFWLGASDSVAPDLILSNMNGGEVARFLANGAVGIGTSAPSYKFQVSSGRSVFEAPSEKYAVGLRYSGAYGNSQFWLGASDSAAPSLLLSNADGVEVARFEAGGNVGIGITPAAGIKLDVLGNIHASGSITGATVVGATYQDVAEWVPAASDIVAGTVVVLDRTHTNRVVASTTSYDTSVAGVVSAAPGVLLGESSDSKKMIATVGRVKVKGICLPSDVMDARSGVTEHLLEGIEC